MHDSSPPEPPRWLILDRDGVINADRSDYVLSVAQWQPLPGALAALARLSRAGVRLAVATNQSAVGRGWLAPAELARIHLHMLRALETAGGRIEAIAVCPHAPGAGCDCRKPAPGLLLRLAHCLDFQPADAVMVGDQARDLEAAAAAGMRALRVGANGEYADLVALADLWLGPGR